MNSFFFQLIEKIGANFFWVQGSGGNISWKDKGILWIKASGTSLSEVNKKEIFLPVDLFHLLRLIESGNFDVTPKIICDSHLRPSIETCLHAIIKSRIVFHLHPIKLLAYLVRLNGEHEVEEIYKEHLSIGVLDYFQPGPPLAQKLSLLLMDADLPNLILLKNHGILIHGDSVEEIKYHLDIIDSLLPDFIFHSNLSEATSQLHIASSINRNGVLFVKIDHDEIQELALNMNLFEMVKNKWALYPDHVVYLGPKANCYESIEAFMSSSAPLNSQIIFIKGVGVFSEKNLKKNTLDMLMCYYEIVIRQERHDLLITLNDNDVNYLTNWDAEKYRQALRY